MVQPYTVLARRYRSQDFSQLLGQEPIAQTLRNAVTSGRIAHAFIFTGTRGVGKTSAARILAKAINCPDAKNGEPCGRCASCKAIAVGEDIDVIEIDGASNNGVDQIRELRQNAGVSPTRSRYKIYIIDEVHMLTTQAFNALLKTLEEPPPHVKFIFATTDIHRVPATILSRCQRYDFKNIPTDVIAAHLAAICRDEKASAQDAALHRIAVLAAGSMRDALSLLDRVLSLGAGEITESLLNELIGAPPLADMCNWVRSMLNGDAAAALAQCDKLLASGMSPEYMVNELTGIFRHLMVMGVCGSDTQLVDVTAESRRQLATLVPQFPPQLAAHHIAICDHTARQLRSSTMPRPLLDALVVRFSMASEFAPIRQWLKELPAGGGAGEGGEKKNDITPGPASGTPAAQPKFKPLSAPAPAPAASPVPPPQAASTVASAAEPIAARPAATPPVALSSTSAFTATTDLPTPATATTAPKQQPASESDEMARFIEALRESGGSSAEVIVGSLLGWRWNNDSSGVTLQINKKVESFVQGQHVRAKIEKAVEITVGRPVRVEFESQAVAETRAKASGGTAAGDAPPTLRISPELRDEVNAHPAVKLLQEKFNAKLVNIEYMSSAEDDSHADETA
ncbi:MAG: DNA polymerase III subunit gamma/tau [Phycisphaerae bacterium]